jgi:hypothetical protein
MGNLPLVEPIAAVLGALQLHFFNFTYALALRQVP